MILFNDMPPKILTIPEIIQELNASGGDWHLIDHTYVLPEVRVTGHQSIANSISSGVVVKTFINANNAEIKAFLAKALDVPERLDL